MNEQTQQAGALADIRVIDLSRVLGGPYCTQILGDHGAEVVKVEPPQGDETRGWGPPFRGETASYFIGVNRNKRGMAIDLTHPAGRELLLRLLEDADVLVENFKPGTLEKWGLGYEVLAARFPRLVHCRISGFGADGPLGGLPGYDAVIQAMGGLMSVNGDADGESLRIGVPIVDMVTGLNAAIGILLALQERARSGRGQFVEATLFDCGISLLHPHAANFFLDAKTPVRTGNAHPNIYPYDTFATASDPIFLAIGNNGQFAKLLEVLEAPQLARDARFVDNRARSVNRAPLKVELERLLARFECEPLAARLIRAGVPCGPVFSVARVVDHPHTRHREMVVEVAGCRGMGSPIKLSRTPATYRHAPPEFAADTLDVLKARGIDAAGYADALPGVAPIKPA
jgi:crotonobetainyl-CoA:carnitine CoA-transferase CaiB-like acyl-CoA transferase